MESSAIILGIDFVKAFPLIGLTSTRYVLSQNKMCQQLKKHQELRFCNIRSSPHRPQLVARHCKAASSTSHQSERSSCLPARSAHAPTKLPCDRPALSQPPNPPQWGHQICLTRIKHKMCHQAKEWAMATISQTRTTETSLEQSPEHARVCVFYSILFY